MELHSRGEEKASFPRLPGKGPWFPRAAVLQDCCVRKLSISAWLLTLGYQALRERWVRQLDEHCSMRTHMALLPCAWYAILWWVMVTKSLHCPKANGMELHISEKKKLSLVMFSIKPWPAVTPKSHSSLSYSPSQDLCRHRIREITWNSSMEIKSDQVCS